MSYLLVSLLSFLLFLLQTAWNERHWFGASPDLLLALVIALALLSQPRVLLGVLLPAAVFRVAFSAEGSFLVLAFLCLGAFFLQEFRRFLFPHRPEMQFALAFLLANAYFILGDRVAGASSSWWGGIGSGILTALAVVALFFAIRESRVFRPLLEPT